MKKLIYLPEDYNAMKEVLVKLENENKVVTIKMLDGKLVAEIDEVQESRQDINPVTGLPILLD